MNERLFSRPLPFNPAFTIAIGLAAFELVFLSVLYKHMLDFTCSNNGIETFCNFFSGFILSAFCVAALLGLFAIVSKAEFQNLLARAGDNVWPLAINLAGFALLIIPVFVLRDGLASSAIRLTGMFWSVGSILAAVGVLLFVAPVPLWRQFFARNSRVVVPLLVLGASMPFLSNLLQPIWNIESITALTFNIVVQIMNWFGYVIEAYPETRVIGADSFYIVVSHLCSGIEGFALVSIFISVYLMLFREHLRFPVALILLPIGILASGILNIVRIVILLMVGLNGNPDLAVGGFHSHAGWLMFTLIALGVIALTHNLSIFRTRAASQRSAKPILDDPIVAKIFPFLVLMGTAVVFSTLTQNPSQHYPVRISIVALATALFIPAYLKMNWSLGAPAVLTGVAIALLWVLFPYDVEDASPPFGALTGGALTLWLIFRGLGTALVIPIVEEVFFRDYLMNKLRFGAGQIGIFTSIIGSSLLFALLHDRWLEAFIAGLAFAVLYQRTGRISDAIVAHITANALIFCYAYMVWDFALI